MRTILAVLIMIGWLQAQTQDFAPPPPVMPDAASLKTIQEKTAELKKALEGVKDSPHYADVAVYLKAAEWIQKHNEWYSNDKKDPKNIAPIVKQTITVLDAGLARVKNAKDAPWRNARNKPIGLGYHSIIDGSFQPYRVTLPEDCGKDPDKRYRLDVVLHGRNATLTEVGFLSACETAKPGKGGDTIVLEVYGRGNNAYRWAGESDVREAMNDYMSGFGEKHVDRSRVVLRGFSMGGAGTWHIGLRHPFQFAAMSPGAGFTVTRGYIANFGQQPDYIERCLKIYDAADYAENLFNIPCVAYSGELDKQRAAVENVEARLKGFKLPLKYSHIIGTGLEHKLPPEWWAKVDEQIRKELPFKERDKVHFVTYTPSYANFRYGYIEEMERQYEKAVIDLVYTEDEIKITTMNVRKIMYMRNSFNNQIRKYKMNIDGQEVDTKNGTARHFIRENGKWRPSEVADRPKAPNFSKNYGIPGPIDDAFRHSFYIVPASEKAWNQAVNDSTQARQINFVKLWDKYFRGKPIIKSGVNDEYYRESVVYFGDPGSNPELAKILPDLPIKWSREELVVNGKTYDCKTHFPVMIYPNKLGRAYSVINTGHTFGEDALKGTNALLYPRLGDWAVMKVVPGKEPEVVDAGIFDSNWQFEKK